VIQLNAVCARKQRKLNIQLVENYKSNTRDILSQLPTYAQLEVIEMLLDEGVRLPSAASLRAVRAYEKRGDYEKASHLAEKAGIIDRAIENRVREHKYWQAAVIAEKAGMIDRAIELYIKAGVYAVAADLMEKKGLTDKAKELRKYGISIYETEKSYIAAAHLAKELGLVDKAKELTQKSKEKEKKEIETRTEAAEKWLASQY